MTFLFYCYSLAADDPSHLIEKVLNDKKLVSRWRACQVLIIDEISMLDAALFELLHEISSRTRGNREKPFGGLQVRGSPWQLKPTIILLIH
jgi:ATP-dependent DNA helicase PIF1